MATPVVMPKIGFAMQEGTISEWLVAEGSEVRQGDPIFAMESEKSVQEVEAPASGKIQFIGSLGETYKVGTVIAEIR